MNTPSQRFDGRVDDYQRFRPGYPDKLVPTLTRHCAWTGPVQIADLGSGTGLSALPLLRAGHRVYGIEPNAQMRAAAEQLLAAVGGFVSVAGSAETTTLADASVDLVMAAQAFHWFDPELAGREARRILRPGGHAAIVWNLRRTSGSAFLDGYEALLRHYGTDYAQVAARYAQPQALQQFFGTTGWTEYQFSYTQHFDFDGLRGRLLSSSYTPAADNPARLPMLAALRELFDRSAQSSQVAFEYDTCLYLGELGAYGP